VVIFFLITVAIGVSIGTLSLVSHYWGMGDRRRAALVTGQSLYLSIIISVIFGIGGYVAARPLLLLLGAHGEVLEMAVVYFRIISVGAASIFVGVSLSAALRASGNATTPFKVMAFAVGLNIVLDPLFIFGLWGFPALGVAGSAIATVISRAAAAAFLAWLVLGEKTHFSFQGVFNKLRWGTIGDIIRVGFYSSIEMLIQSAAALVILKIVAPFGTAALAAFGVATRIRMMLLMPGIGVGYAAGVMVGQNLGAGSPGRARHSSWLALLVYYVMLVPVVVCLIFFSYQVVRLFNSDPDVMRLGGNCIFYIAISMFFIAFTVIFGKCMNGAGDTKDPMVISAVSLILFGIPLAYVMGRFWGVDGVWVAILITSIVRGGAVLFWFERGTWMRRGQINRVVREAFSDYGV
jgi:putative MATE family efflux protein